MNLILISLPFLFVILIVEIFRLRIDQSIIREITLKRKLDHLLDILKYFSFIPSSNTDQLIESADIITTNLLKLEGLVAMKILIFGSDESRPQHILRYTQEKYIGDGGQVMTQFEQKLLSSLSQSTNNFTFRPGRELMGEEKIDLTEDEAVFDGVISLKLRYKEEVLGYLVILTDVNQLDPDQLSLIEGSGNIFTLILAGIRLRHNLSYEDQLKALEAKW